MSDPTDDSEENQAECDLHTLIEAQKIRNDKVRSVAAMQFAEQQKAAIDSLKKGNSNGK